MNLNQLKELNLSEGQIKVYKAVLELGISTIHKIQEKTGIERRNIYDILNKLIERGFISHTTEKGKRTYQTTHPDKILGEIKEKEEALKQLKKQMPQIRDLFQISRPDIRAEVFRGNESLKALMDEILDYKESYWIGGNSGVEKTNLRIWFRHWMERRVKQKHILYDLADHGTYLKGLEPNNIAKHKRNYYKQFWLPKKLKSPMLIAIFGNKVAQILWSEQSFAFVLDSKEIKESFMKYFHYFWKNPY